MVRCGIVAVGLAWLAGVAAASGGVFDIDSGNPDAGLPYDIRAATMGSREGGSILTAEGNVYIRQGRQIITAGFVEINRTTDELVARENVVFVRWDGTVWKGPELKYNFKTGVGDFGRFLLYRDPYYLHGEEFKMISRDRIEIRDVVLTTCEGDDREFEIVAERATLTDQKYLTMYNVVTYLGPVPIFWTPYYRRNMTGGRGGGWAVIPGFSSRLGAFVLSTYHYWLDDEGVLTGETSINGYSKRGVGVGQGVLWGSRQAGYQGRLDGFYIDDDRIYRDENEREDRQATLTDSERYRLRLRHAASLSARDSLYADATYLSDPYVRYDFFRRESRSQVQPENRAAWTHRGESYIFSVLANARLNDFYGNVNRLPEATLTIPSLRLGNSPFYYESRTAASGLERVYAETSDNEDFDALRVDSLHTVYLPRRLFGFLALTPRAGWRGTYYSTTYAPVVSVTNQVTVLGSNGVSTVTNQVTSVRDELGADFRNVYELGFETSYKAYKVLEEGETIWGRGLRHVVEPYANYTYVPDPDLVAANLPQFDSADQIAGRNTVQFGFRHKLQTRRTSFMYVDHSITQADDPLARNAEGMDQTELSEIATDGNWTVHDLVNADIGTVFDLDPDEDEEDFGPLYATLRFWPSRTFRMDLKTYFDLYGEGMTFFDGQMSFAPRGGAFLLNANYLVQGETREQVAAQLQINPRGRWTFGAYGRYDLLDGELDSHTYYLRHRMDCIGWGIGIEHEPGYDGEEDDITAWLQIWLLAMPYLTADLGG